MFNERVSNDSARACLDLADRIFEKYIGGRVSGRPAALPKRKRKIETKPRKYGKHNPVPVEMKAEIIRRARQTGPAYERYGQIAASMGLSHCTVKDICLAAGIHRKPGRVKQAA